MIIRSGSDRWVILLPGLNLALKFPRIYWRNIRGNLKRMVTSKTWLYNELFESNVYTWSSFKRRLFKGMYENWSEFVFYAKTRHPFCVPTYFSFFGLLNVQQMVETYNIKIDDLWCQLQELANMSLIKNGSHHWTIPENFSYSDSNLKMLDYGNPKVQRAIREYGLKIQEQFNPNYCWEERKEELLAQKALKEQNTANENNTA